MNKDPIIIAKILTAMSNGMELNEAFDFVIGEGAYAKLAGDLYDALRAKQGL